MKADNKILLKGIKTISIALPIIIIAPIVLTMGFKGVLTEEPVLGYVLLIVGFIAVVTGIILLIKGITYLLDHLFKK